jgi:hypothetical protein
MLVGASVILLATALGSGELLIWPYITTQAGVGLLWLATLGFLSQYFLNMEIERYTLATGETAVAGFTRFWKPWGIIFILGAILPNLFPGWVTSSATAITFTFGGVRIDSQARVLDERGNRAEALQAYEELRKLLREELGASPSPATQEVHRRLRAPPRGGGVPTRAPAAPPQPSAQEARPGHGAPTSGPADLRNGRHRSRPSSDRPGAAMEP